LDIFERNKPNFETKEEEISDHIVLIGANRMGEGIWMPSWKKKEKVLVVDFGPDIIEKLNKKEQKTFFWRHNRSRNSGTGVSLEKPI